jgi:hypothetical protein
LVDAELEDMRFKREPVAISPALQDGEVLAQAGRLPRPSWGFVVALVLVVVVGTVSIDGRVRAREDKEIASCRRGLGAATDYAEGRLGLVSHYLQQPLMSRGRIQQLHLADLMSARADEVLPRAQRAEGACQRITLKPWHLSQVQRHDVETAYAAVLVTLLETIAAQGVKPFFEDNDLQRLREAARIG